MNLTYLLKQSTFCFLLVFTIAAQSQNVGIGTADPDGKLEISTVSELNKPHIQLNEESNDDVRIRFQNTNVGNYWTIGAYIGVNAKGDRFKFSNQTNGDLMSLTGDGQLGLGVGISPKTKFHVGNEMSVLFGTDTLGPGDKLMFLPDLHAFRVGTVATGAASTYWNRDSIGLYSFASGLNTRAQGYGATAMGRDTEATNDYAFATGHFTNADGRNSTAMGFSTDASAIYSVAIGNAVRAQSYASTAIGSYNVGGGNAVTWMGSDPLFEIGNGTTPSTRSNAMTVLKDGRVGIGTRTPSQELHVIGTIRVGSFEEISDGGGATLSFNSDLVPTINDAFDLGNSDFRWDNVFATNGTISTSDRRNKDNIRGLSYGLAEIMQLKPVSFTWKRDRESGTKLGLIAQDLQKVIKEVVVDTEWQTDEETGRRTAVPMERLGVYYSDLIPVLIKGMQEQQEQIEKLTNKITTQEAELNEMRSLSQEVADLKKTMAQLSKVVNQ